MCRRLNPTKLPAVLAVYIALSKLVLLAVLGFWAAVIAGIALAVRAVVGRRPRKD